MSAETFFQVCQDGDVEKLRGQLEQDGSVDVNVQDAHGMTGLAYAARNGHVDVVRELLSRGATKTDLLEQGYGLDNHEIASMLGAEPQQQQQQHGAEAGAEGYAVMPVDIHGGQQMPDGTISYMNASNFGQGFQMMPPFLGAPYPPHFYPEGMHAPPAVFQPGNGVGRRGNPGHGRKESAANLPPLEVSRMIPCKYFPHCKYGDKCHFAHPQIGLPVSMPPQAHPLSPTMSQPPPMQAMYYQQMPPGYPYMSYGNGPQPFIPMGPPTPLQQHHQQPQQPFGAPQHFASSAGQPQQGDVQSAGQAPEGTGGEGQRGSSPHVNGAAPQPNGITSAPQHERSDAPQPPTSSDAASKSNEQVSTATAASPSPAQASGNQSGSAAASPQAQSAEQESSAATTKPVHRRQSFNSFLHHHAVPFQPQGPSAGSEGVPMMNGHAFVPRATQGTKPRRMAGVNGVGANGYANAKRSPHSGGGERQPCTFFQAGRCRYGDECRFPHVLIDGTDARPMQAQQRQAAAAQLGAVNGAPARSANTHNAPASAPTGPQADKRAQQQQQQPSLQQKEQPQQQASSSSSQPTPAQAQGQERQQPHTKGGKSGNQANGIVRSNPSKTTQAATAAAGGKEGGGKKQKQQNQQQGQQLPRHSQRVPTVNDFPALSSPNPNGSSSSTSPMPTPSAAAATPNGNDAGASAPAAASAAAPKVNFSAILSAPAPPKQPKAAPTEAASGANGESTAAEAAPAENGAPADGAAESKADASAQPVKTHATAAAALAAGIPTSNGTSGSAAAGKPQQASAQVNGKDKPRAQPNGVAHKEGGKSPVSYKAVAAAPAPAKATPNGASAAESEDDFQLVNRSRSASKRPSQGGSASGGKGGDGYAPQVKAVAA